MKLVRFVVVAALASALAVPASAQVWEITPYLGYTTGGSLELVPEGFSGEFEVKDAMTYGIGLGVSPHRGFTFEGRWTVEPTSIFFDQSVGSDIDISDMTIHQIHGNFLAWKAYPTNTVRPFLLLGLGATIFDPKAGNLDSETKFSWALGAGVIKDMSEKAALRFQARYTPTYIKDDPGGYWCDPFYGCYYLTDPEYLDVWEFSAGLTFKFGQY